MNYTNADITDSLKRLKTEVCSHIGFYMIVTGNHFTDCTPLKNKMKSWYVLFHEFRKASSRIVFFICYVPLIIVASL